MQAALTRRATFVLVAMIVAISSLATTGYALWRLRAQTIDRQLETAALTARALEDHLTQSFNVIDRTLVNAPEELGDLAILLRQAPYLRSIAVLGSGNTISLSSSPGNVGIRLVLDDFLPQTNGPVEVLRAGSLRDGRDFLDARPIDSENPTPTLSFIPISRDVRAPDGRWTTVVASVNTDYFLNFYSRHITADKGVVQLLRYDGRLLLSTDEHDKPGALSRGDRIVAAVAETEAGRFEEQPDHGRAVLAAYRASRVYPFVIVVRLDKEQALTNWRQEMINTVSVVCAVLLSALTLASLYFVRFERVAREQERVQDRLRIAAIAFESREGMVVTDADAIVLQINQAFTDITGYTAEDAVGQNMNFLKSGQHDAAFYAAIRASVTRTGVWHGEIMNRHKDGTIHPHALSITAVCSDTGKLTHYVGTLTDITARKLAEESLLTLSRAVEQSPVSIVITDPAGDIQYVNPKFEQITGYLMAEVIGNNPRILRSGEKSPIEYKEMWDTITSGNTWQGEFHNRRKDGSLFWELASISPVFNDAGVLLHFVAIKEDITARKQFEEKLQLAASVFSHSREGIMITATDGTIIDVNGAFTRITGYDRDEVLGRKPNLLSSGRQGHEFYARMWRGLIEKGHWYGEIWNRRKSGEVYAEMLTISTVHDLDGSARQYVALFSDVTTAKEHERQLEHVAHYDALTSLPNRVLLADRLQQAMAQADRRGQQLAVAYLDLDGFKVINDSHGHEAGDQLLIAVASRMKQVFREGDTLARLGGDEFVAVLPDLVNVADSVPLLARLLSAAAQPVQVGNLLLQVSASVGVTFYPQADDVDADQLLRQADQAMYQAKLAGKNRYHLFDAEQDRSLRGHHESLEHIRHALSERQFVLHYQPKVNMRSGKVIGAEALIRWQHPERGLLAPAVFLPVIEDHPLAVDIGEWVIDAALTQMERWQAAGLDIPVSVNIGARQLQQSNFVERLQALLAAHPAIKPADLEMEVLETSALEDLARVSQVIAACRELGVMFALDDFGTGYSSLTYLKRLAVTQLKIDQSFVHNMLDDPDDLAILDGVLSLAVAFRRQVIAEGVETVEHGEMLLQLGCELAQGYGIARPMPAADVPSWAATWRPDPIWIDRPSLSRKDLPLLFASVEHRAWIAAVLGYLRLERNSPPPLAHDQCRFGMWLQAEGLARHGEQPVFVAIDMLHRQVHALATELCELRATGQVAQARLRLHELHGLRDHLLEQLKMLLQANRLPV
ncbi:MAG: EAL domain-containing protein [Leptothrix sp. (in: b-proteobacteria)]